MHIAEQRRRTLLKDFHDTWSSITTAKHYVLTLLQHTALQHLPPYTFPCLLSLLPSLSPFGAVILILFLLFCTPSFASFFLSFPPLTPMMLQGHRMARLYLPFLLSSSPHLHVLASQHHVHCGYTLQFFRSDHKGWILRFCHGAGKKSGKSQLLFSIIISVILE